MPSVKVEKRSPPLPPQLGYQVSAPVQLPVWGGDGADTVRQPGLGGDGGGYGRLHDWIEVEAGPAAAYVTPVIALLALNGMPATERVAVRQLMKPPAGGTGGAPPQQRAG